MSLHSVEPVEDLSGSVPAARGLPAHDVFVSYSNVNKPVADAIVSRLEQEGVRCWVAPRDVTPGQNFAEAIMEAIETSRLMVVVVSSDANQSQHVPREVERAVHNNVVVIPFRIESVEPSGAMAYFLASEHWLDAMTPPLETHIAHLVEAVDKLLERTPLPSPAPQPPTPKRRSLLHAVSRKWLLIGAVVLILGVAGGLFAVLQPGSSGPSPAVATFNGTTDVTTKNFTVSNPWKLTWKVDSSMDIGPLVDIDSSSGEIIDTIDTNTSGSGSQVVSHGGTFHLHISVYGDTTYTFTVTNGS